MRESNVRLALLALSAASGCAALIYQIVWFEALSLAIGASAISLGLLPAVFLGGLCLGSLLAERIAPPGGHPLRAYAAIELGIAALGALALPAIARSVASTSRGRGAVSPGCCFA